MNYKRQGLDQIGRYIVKTRGELVTCLCKVNNHYAFSICGRSLKKGVTRESIVRFLGNSVEEACVSFLTYINYKEAESELPKYKHIQNFLDRENSGFMFVPFLKRPEHRGFCFGAVLANANLHNTRPGFKTPLAVSFSELMEQLNNNSYLKEAVSGAEKGE